MAFKAACLYATVLHSESRLFPAEQGQSKLTHPYGIAFRRHLIGKVSLRQRESRHCVQRHTDVNTDSLEDDLPGRKNQNRNYLEERTCVLSKNT